MDRILHEDLTTASDVIPFLKECTKKRKHVPLGSLLQVQLVTNISVPTYEEPNYNDSSAMYTFKLVVTDGHSHACALVPDSLPGISMKTPPGTKIRIIQPVPVVQGKLLILMKTNCEVLGGKVKQLIEKWEVQKKMAIKHEWGYAGSVSNVAGEAPPAWKPFGHRSSSNADLKAMRKMKTTDVVVAGGKKEGAEEAKSQFDVQRDEAIQEGVSVNKSKTFQKPNKHLLAKEITDVMNQGFSQVEAESAMRRFKNFHKALKFLKESRDRQEGREVPKKPFEMERKFYQRKGRKGDDEDEDRQDVPAEFKRPANDVSLFGFIEGQIKAGDDEKLTKSLKLVVNKAPEESVKDLEAEMERLAVRGPENEMRKHHEMRGGVAPRRGGRGWRRGRGGGNDIRRPHSPQHRWEENNDHKTGKHVPPPRFQNNGQRGHHRRSKRSQPNNYYQAQEQQHRSMQYSGKDPRMFSVASAGDPMRPNSMPFGQDSRTSSYGYDPNRIFSASAGNNHRMLEPFANDSYSPAFSEQQVHRYNYNPSNACFTQHPPPPPPTSNHVPFTRFPPPPLPSNYNNQHFQAPSSHQISSDLHQLQRHDDVSHVPSVQSNLWDQVQFVTSTASGTSIYTQNQRQPPTLPDNPQLLNPTYGYVNPALVSSGVPVFQCDEELSNVRNPAFVHPSPPPGFMCAQSLGGYASHHRQD